MCQQRLEERNAEDGQLIDPDRMEITRSALHEIEAISKAIRRAVQEDSQESELLIRGMTGRIKSLSDAAHGALFCNGEESTEDLREVVDAER